MLSQINQFLIDLLGPFGPLIVVGMLGLSMVLLTLPLLLRKERDPLDRLRAGNAEPGKAKRGDALRQNQGHDKLEKYSNFLEPQDEKEFSAIRLKLLQAGYRTKNAVRIYHFSQFALGILLLLAGVAYSVYNSSTGTPTTQATILSILIPGAVGYMLPKYWVTRRQATRQEAIVNGFPQFARPHACLRRGRPVAGPDHHPRQPRIARGLSGSGQ